MAHITGGAQVKTEEQPTSPTLDKGAMLKLLAEISTASPEDLYQLGEKRFQQGKYAEAEVIYRELLRSFPAFSPAYLQLARAQIEVKKIDQAYDNAKKAVELLPDNSMAHRTLGRVYRLQDKRLLAIAEFKKACSLNPKNAWNFNNLGLTLLELGRDEEALPVLEKAVELDSSHYVMFNNLAVARLRLKDKAGALTAFEKALELKPDFKSAQQQIAKLKSELKTITPTPAASPGFLTTPTLGLEIIESPEK